VPRKGVFFRTDPICSPEPFEPLAGCGLRIGIFWQKEVAAHQAIFAVTLDHMKKLPPVEADDIIEPEGKTKKGGSRYVLYRY